MNQANRRLKRIKHDVIERDGLLCCFCDKVLTMETMTLDHIVPDSKRGTFNATNLTVACKDCNQRRGNQSFFVFCREFNFPEEKIAKYKTLYFNNLKIKVLNIAKGTCLKRDTAIPKKLIVQACKILKIKTMDFTDYERIYALGINFSEECPRKDIMFVFAELIRIIEAEC
jgi:hypothetical protein